MMSALALWLVDTCTTARGAFAFPVIGIRGRL
jgi:hypothetical protein